MKWVAGALLAAGLAVGAWAALGGGTSKEPGTEGEAAAARFLDLVRAGQVDAAWAGTAAEFKSYMGQAEFRKFVKGTPALKQPVTPVGDGPAATPSGSEFAFRTADGRATVRVGVGSDGGAWKVDRVAVE